MEQVDLRRYDVSGILGTGADYEVRAAVERETGKQVVLKRPHPHMVRRQLHAGIETRTDRTLQVYQEVGHTIPTVVSIVGYTDRANHDAYFGETLEQAYRVIVEERAAGIPLVGDPMARILGVPIGIGQNLFTLFPLVQPASSPPFAIHRQLLDLEEAFCQAGYVLLDLRPQNIFYAPGAGRITAIDCGALVHKNGEADRRGGRPPRDLHDFYLEMLKFYTTAQRPPAQARGYWDPYGLRPVISFEQEVDRLGQTFKAAPDLMVRDAALTIIGLLRQRAYAAFDDFRRDLMAYLEAVRLAHQALPNLTEARQVWAEALNELRADYWQRYLFDAESELAGFNLSDQL
jgi:hypothetical protein